MTTPNYGLKNSDRSLEYANLANAYSNEPVKPQGPGVSDQSLNALSNIGGGAAGGAAGGPWGAVAGGVLGAAKTGLDIYNTIQGNSQAQKTYEMQKKAYDEEVKRREQDRMRMEEQQRIANMYAGANNGKESYNNRDELASYYSQRGY